MTSPKDNIIIAEHGTITQEALLAYLNDELTVEQKQQAENLLKNDPFSQDALEGLRGAQDKAAVSSSLTTIHRKVNERIGKREKRIIPFHWSNYAYAAVILGLLISVAFIFTAYLNKHQENIAMNKSPDQNTVVPQQEELKQAPPAATAPPVADTVKTTPTSTGVAITKSEEVKPTAKEKAQKESAPKANQPASDIVKAKDEAALAAKKATEDKAKNISPAQQNVTLNDVSITNNNANNANYTTSPTPSAPNTRGQMTSIAANNRSGGSNSRMSAVAPKTVAAEESVQQADGADDAHARKSFFAGEYKRSEAQYDSVLQKQPGNADALFFGGISNYVNGNLDKAEKNFDKLLQNNKRYVDGAKWYKANILLKKGQREPAVNLLQELSHSKGSYKARAQQKITDLQNQ